MNSEKRYNLERNRAFNSARTQEDRRAYRAIMRSFRGHLMVGDRQAYLDALLAHGNKAASFPTFPEWVEAKATGEQP